MGDIAEMMLDGTLCSSCGEYLEEGENIDQVISGIPNDCYGCKDGDER